MPNHDTIRHTFGRNRKALALRPALGQGTAVTRVRVTDGLRCEIEDGTWSLTSDLAEKSGGTNAAPNPGVYGRSALGACLAMTYVMWAAHRGIRFDALAVDVEADYDARGYHGVDEVVPGYEALRYVVSVECDAEPAQVLAWLDEADAHCDFLQVFSQPQVITREVRHSRAAEVAS